MDKIDEFLEYYNANESWEKHKQSQDEFVNEFTAERIKSLSLDEYYQAGNRKTFCYRLEYDLKGLASMGNMHADGYGVYIDSGNHIKIYRSLKKYENDYMAAFEFEKDEIIRLLKAAEDDDYDAISKSLIQQQFRFKLLTVYYPDKFFPVCTLNTAKAYCGVAGIGVATSDKMIDLNRKLVLWKEENLPDDWTLHKAMMLVDFFWRKETHIDASEAKKYYSKEVSEKIESEIDALHLVGTMREAVVKQRVNQGEFRKRLLKSADKRCRLCQVDNEQFLVASHIKPWRDSEPEERLDVNNGFLMCPNHDKAFDLGYISFDDDGRIIVSSELTKTSLESLNISKEMRIELKKENKKFLAYHRAHIFKKSR